MSKLQNEPPPIRSMEQLLATGDAMEREAIAGYAALSARMRAGGRADLCAVFDRLIAEEARHLAQIKEWSGEAGLSATDHAPERVAPEMFDDDGARDVAPELLGAYRAFTMAVRNEERAFAFWSHVAAHAPDAPIREAAERMAREELGHVAILRQERRRAFHESRRAGPTSALDVARLEHRLADQLEALSVATGAADYAGLARDARNRSAAVVAEPFDRRISAAMVHVDQLTHPGVISEWLLDAYLHCAEHEKSENMRNRAQQFAADLLRTLDAAQAMERRTIQDR